MHYMNQHQRRRERGDNFVVCWAFPVITSFASVMCRARDCLYVHVYCAVQVLQRHPPSHRQHRHLSSLISSLQAQRRLPKWVACLAAHMEQGQSLKRLLKAVPKLPPQAACPVARLHQQSPRVSRSSWAGAPALVPTFSLFPFPSMIDSS